jgi:hypothetical protein
LAFSVLEGKKNSASIQNWVKKCKAAFAWNGERDGRERESCLGRVFNFKLGCLG